MKDCALQDFDEGYKPRCHLYRLLRSLFTTTMHWKEHDPFLADKLDSFEASSAAIYSEQGLTMGRMQSS